MSGTSSRNAPAATPCRITADGIILTIRLTPRSSRDLIEGIEQRGDILVLKARVRAAPDKGKANAALEKLISKWMGVPRTSVQLVSGSTSRIKSLLIAGDSAILAKTFKLRLSGTI